MELTEKQKQGLLIAKKRYNNRERYTCIAGAAGTGKAQPIDTEIPTPIGIKKLSDLKIGDYVFDRYGKQTKVLGIYHQGILKNYKVMFSDGRETYCNDEHLWSYITNKDSLKTVPLKDMINSGLKHTYNKGGYKYKIPMSHAVEYCNNSVKIDPYVVGAFIGDGCCSQKQLTISSSDEELVAEISRLIGAKKYIKNSSKNFSWTFFLNETMELHRSDNVKFLSCEFFKDYISELLCGSHEKRIPNDYKYTTIDNRFKLLQGLFDTDGSITFAEGRGNIRYTSVNYNLILDIREILFSLGYSSTISEDIRLKYSKGKCYSLSINIPNDEKENFFRLKRKKNIANSIKTVKKRRNYEYIFITNIVEVEPKEMLCIKVDNIEELYLTNDYIVTHNTTMVNFLIDELGFLEEEVAFACFTGKASLVLREKGLKAMTLHKLLYNSYLDKRTGKFVHYPKKELDISYQLIIVDEISMVSNELWLLLLRHNIHIIALGDPFQLPPIGKGNGILDKPHIFLDEVVRQALDSEIILWATKIRNGGRLEPFFGKQVRIFKKEQFNPDMYEWADQILVGTNNTRRNINHEIRQRLGYDTKLVNEGEKVICLRNYWDTENGNGLPLINGIVGTIEKIHTTNTIVACDFYPYGDTVDIRNVIQSININKYILFGGEIINEAKLSGRLFEFGYAVTTHKAQGSEWNNVLIFDESKVFGESRNRWLYTAITRAKEKLIIII